MQLRMLSSKKYRNSKQVPCKEYSKWTRSAYKFCDIYAKKYRAKKQYHQKKLVKLAEAPSDPFEISLNGTILIDY